MPINTERKGSFGLALSAFDLALSAFGLALSAFDLALSALRIHVFAKIDLNWLL